LSTDAIREAWEETARVLGGRLEATTRAWYLRLPGLNLALRVTLDGVEVLTEGYAGPHISGSYYTKLEARARRPGDLSLRVSPPPGDAPDAAAALLIEASDDDLARAWLDEPLRGLMAAARRYTFQLKSGVIRAHVTDPRRVWVGAAGFIEDDPRLLASAIRAVAALARRGEALLADWEALARALGGVPSAEGDAFAPGAVRIDAQRAGVPVAVDIHTPPGAARHQTRARAARRSAQRERFVLAREAEAGPGARGEVAALPPELRARFTLRAERPEAAAALLSPLSQKLLQLEPDALLAEDEAVTLLCPGIEMSLERLKVAIEVVAALSSPPGQGPYR
jgi:hypothetical protein